MQSGFYLSKYQYHTRVGDMGVLEMDTVGLGFLQVNVYCRKDNANKLN